MWVAVSGYFSWPTPKWQRDSHSCNLLSLFVSTNKIASNQISTPIASNIQPSRPRTCLSNSKKNRDFGEVIGYADSGQYTEGFVDDGGFGYRIRQPLLLAHEPPLERERIKSHITR